MKKSILFLICALGLCFLRAQELARRPFLGVQLTDITADVKRVMQLNDTNGVLVKSVVKNSTAEGAGFKAGDILLSINGTKLSTAGKTVKLVAGHAGGQNFTYELLRDKSIVKGRSVFKTLPVESYDNIEMQYTAVKTVNGLQRLIVSKPLDKTKHPAVVFIGGIGCYSLDFPFEPDRSEVQLLNKLTRDGYVCVRAEKPGVGDNGKCTPCAEVSFHNEVAGYISAVNDIKKYDYVDSNRVYVIGHSMGGVMAPLIAQKTKLAGIVAYGTIGSSFIEYLAKTRRTIGEAYHMPPDSTDDMIKNSCECAGYYFVDRLTTAQAAKKNPVCGEYLPVFDYRSRAYNNELYAINIPAIWKEFKGKALLMWGESDFIASKEDHEIIANAVNFYHKGNAVFMSVPASSHGMNSAASFAEAIGDEGKYNPEVGIKISGWLKNEG